MAQKSTSRPRKSSGVRILGTNDVILVKKSALGKARNIKVQGSNVIERVPTKSEQIIGRTLYDSMSRIVAGAKAIEPDKTYFEAHLSRDLIEPVIGSPTPYMSVTNADYLNLGGVDYFVNNDGSSINTTMASNLSLGLSSISEDDRLALLKSASEDADDYAVSIDGLSGSFDTAVFSRAINILGGSAVVGSIRSEFDLIAQLQNGFPVAVVENLRQVGLDAQLIEEAIAPKRTLARRKAEGQRLTTTESEATWRLAHLIAFAEKVFAGLQAALSWLARPKLALGGRKPTDLLSTALGTARVEFLLRELEWGNT